MQMHIDLKELDPPTGTIRFEGHKDAAFVGWLGLIHSLEELIGVPAR